MANSNQTFCIPLENDSVGQTISIPQDFALPGREARITREKDGTLSIAPIRTNSAKALYDLISSWEPLGEEDAMPDIPELPLEPVDF
jgi:virulence-associated protein VagC